MDQLIELAERLAFELEVLVGERAVSALDLVDSLACAGLTLAEDDSGEAAVAYVEEVRRQTAGL